MTRLELLFLILLVMGSAFLSGSEVALFTLSRFQIRHLKERFRPLYDLIKRLLADPGGLLATILVANELINISLSVLVATALSREWASVEPWLPAVFRVAVPDWAVQTVVGTFFTAPIVLVVCEITPKVFAARTNMLVASMTARPLSWVYRIFRPIRWTLYQILSLISRGMGRAWMRPDHGPAHSKQLLREEDFLTIVEEGHKEGAIEQSELDLIKNVFELDDTTVEAAVTPLSRVLSFGEATTARAALSALKTRPFSRIPILGDGKKKVLGILYAKDLLTAQLDPSTLDRPVADLARKPLAVPTNVRLSALFRRMKRLKTHMAVVEGERGETLGIVTMDDIFDVLLEDLGA